MLLIVALLAIDFGPAAGQEAQERSLARTLAQIRPNSSVRVATPTDTLSGRLLRVASDSLYILPREDPRAMPWVAVDTMATPLAAVTTLWTRGGGDGVVIGAVAGAVGLNVLIFAMMMAGAIPCDGCGLTPVFPAMIGVVGAGVGGAIGAGSWQPVYPQSR